MANFREENLEERIRFTLKWFKDRGFNVKKNIDDLATPFMREAIEKSRDTGEDYSILLEQKYGSCLMPHLKEVANHIFHFLRRRYPNIIRNSDEETIVGHLNNLTFYVCLNYGLEKKIN